MNNNIESTAESLLIMPDIYEAYINSVYQKYYIDNTFTFILSWEDKNGKDLDMFVEILDEKYGYGHLYGITGKYGCHYKDNTNNLGYEKFSLNRLNIKKYCIEYELESIDINFYAHWFEEKHDGNFKICYTSPEITLNEIGYSDIQSKDITDKKYYTHISTITYNPFTNTFIDKRPLTFIALEDNTIIKLNNNGIIGKPLQMYSSLNNADWIEYNINTEITLNKGQTVSFKNLNNTFSESLSNFYEFKITSGSANIYGNCNSLINFTNILSPYVFYKLFNSCNIHNAQNLFLPSPILTEGCYKSMFAACNKLEIGPDLPATTLADICYSTMFHSCYKLIVMPKILAITLAYGCCASMFMNCINLLTCTNLPAMTLADSCYSSMFRNCKQLNRAPELPASSLAPLCYFNMFKDCINLSTTPNLPADKLSPSCYYQMFWGCSSLIYSTKLNATEIADYCYARMFLNCSSLITIPELPATTLATNCYWCMFTNCINLSSTTKLPALDLTNECYCHMFEGCINLSSTPELPATGLADWCYAHMFANCINIYTPPVLSATEMKYRCYRSMFDSCYNLSSAPELPATKLDTECYSWMFWHCTNLSTAPLLPATELPPSCYNGLFAECTKLSSISTYFTNWNSKYDATTNWVTNIANNGKFYYKDGLDISLSGVSYIPNNWEIIKLSDEE